MSARIRCRTLLLGGAAAAATVALAGCGSPSILSRTSVGSCYRAIPTATSAVHDAHARLLGVHRVPVDQVERHLSPEDTQRLDNDTTVCAVAFEGTFGPDQVTGASDDRSGSYAVVLVSDRRLRLVSSFVLDHLPKGLKGRFS